jgi:hypothetical protein
MEYIQITNWDKWQSYRKDRGQPPWIKIHRRVMRNPEWVSLSDGERGQLVAMWLLAADHDGVIPASPEVIQKLCFMSKPPNLSKFHELGFLASNGCQDGVMLASSGSQVVTPKAEAEGRSVKMTPDKRQSGVKMTPKCGAFENVSLSEEELQKLKDQFGDRHAELIENLSSYIASKGKKYKSHYATILTWERKNNPNGNSGNGERPRNVFLDD